MTLEYFALGLDQLQPSQLFISAEKLAQVMETFDPNRPEALKPIPIKKLNGRLIYTDGHTRGLAAYLSNWEQVPVYWDQDELDWDAYQICVDWCLRERIYTVADLQRRILSSADYEVLWLERCQKMHQELAHKRQKQLEESA